MTSSPAVVGNDEELCSFCAHGEYLATLQKLSQKKPRRVSYCVHEPSRLHAARGRVFPSEGADCEYEKQAVVVVMGRVA